MILTRDLPENEAVPATANPMLDSTAGEAFDAGFGADTLGSLVLRAFRTSAASKRIEQSVGPGGVLETRAVEREDTVSADRLNEQYPGVTFDRAMTPEAARIIAEAQKAQQIRDDIIARSPKISGGAAALAGGLAGMALDPLEVATAFVPVVGPAQKAIMVGRLGRFGGRVAEGIIEGAIGNALTEPAYYGLSRSQGLDYSMGDALMNVGLGGALGGLLGGAAAVAGRVAGKADTGAVRLPERPVERPVLDPRESMTPPQRQAALRTSVAQTAQGRAVDVEMVPRPQTLVEALQRVGVRDEGGDFAAMGLTDWQRQRRFEKNAIREDGLPRDEAAAALWQMGYLRDQPEAQQMRAAEMGMGEAPDLVRAMDRAVDAELRGQPQFAERDASAVAEWQGQAALREQVRRRDEMREYLGERAEGITDQGMDRIIARVDQGDTPEQAVRSTFAPREEPEELGDMPGWSDEELDEFQARSEEAALLDEEDEVLSTRIADLQRRGLLTEEDVAAITEMDFIGTKVSATREVAMAAAQCLV